MRYTDHNTCEDIRIAYVGGGSKAWAWGLMSDLADAGDLSGQVVLYDIEKAAAERNAIIGNKYNDLPECKSRWDYSVADTLDEALSGADFVIISILPGTFDEMEVDVHAPEKYGIFQSVGDTTGPGGVLRSLRTIPMMEVIAKGIQRCCPRAWVINYTNPMAQCVKALYSTFPGIRAYGCCHEVYGAQYLLAVAADEFCNGDTTRRDMKLNVVGVNHFTWITGATWRNVDMMPVYRKFAEKYRHSGSVAQVEENELNKSFATKNQVKFDLFLRFGSIAAAGDRHLVEFCPKNWYLGTREGVRDWGFTLTSVRWRKDRQAKQLEQAARLVSGEEQVVIKKTGEEGVIQMRALLGLNELITNVNLPNVGQIPNLPLGTIVETNAAFRGGSLTPLFSGPIPNEIDALVRRIADAQLLLAEAGRDRDLEKAFAVFLNDPLVDLPADKARALFDEMVAGTAPYLTEYRR